MNEKNGVVEKRDALLKFFGLLTNYIRAAGGDSIAEDLRRKLSEANALPADAAFEALCGLMQQIPLPKIISSPDGTPGVRTFFQAARREVGNYVDWWAKVTLTELPVDDELRAKAVSAFRAWMKAWLCAESHKHMAEACQNLQGRGSVSRAAAQDAALSWLKGRDDRYHP